MPQLQPPPHLDLMRYPWKLWATRGVIVALALVGWYWSQSLIGAAPKPVAAVADRLFDVTAPVNAALTANPAAADALLVVSSLCIDALGLWLLLSGVLGPTVRPVLGLVILFAMRQVCQGIVGLPAPDGMIWRNPLPFHSSLLVTYETANDFFFSGHTAIAVLGAVELWRTGRRSLMALGVAIALFEMTTVIVLRAHYTMDVYTGVVTALLVGYWARLLAPWCDRRIGSLVTPR